MVLSILRKFSGYDLRSILNIPYKHFQLLFELAERADGFDALTAVKGRAMAYSKELQNELTLLQDSKYVKDVMAHKNIVTQENKDKAEQIAKSLR